MHGQQVVRHPTSPQFPGGPDDRLLLPPRTASRRYDNLPQTTSRSRFARGQLPRRRSEAAGPRGGSRSRSWGRRPSHGRPPVIPRIDALCLPRDARNEPGSHGSSDPRRLVGSIRRSSPASGGRDSASGGRACPGGRACSSGGRACSSGGRACRDHCGGRNSGLRSRGLSRTCHGVAWRRVWWARQSSTRLSRLVAPPSAQCWRWWASQASGSRRQPGKRQCWSRRTRAFQIAVVTSRLGAADVEDLTQGAEDGGDDVGITRQPADGGDGELVAGVQRRRTEPLDAAGPA